MGQHYVPYNWPGTDHQNKFCATEINAGWADVVVLDGTSDSDSEVHQVTWWHSVEVNCCNWCDTGIVYGRAGMEGTGHFECWCHSGGFVHV